VTRSPSFVRSRVNTHIVQPSIFGTAARASPLQRGSYVGTGSKAEGSAGVADHLPLAGDGQSSAASDPFRTSPPHFLPNTNREHQPPMSGSDITPRAIRDVLAPFGALRPQFPFDWTGKVTLHPSLTRFYEDVGPHGEDGLHGSDGLTIPTTGNPFEIAPLARLGNGRLAVAGMAWAVSAWRNGGTSGWSWPTKRGDPFILDQTSGAVLHAQHGEGSWKPEPMFADVFVTALILGTIGAVHEGGGEKVYKEGLEARPEWQAASRARLAPTLGAIKADTVASRLGW